MFSIFFSNEIPIYRWITFARIFLVLCHCYLPSEKLTFVTLGSLRGCHFKTTLRERAFLFLSFFVKTCSAQVTHVSTEVYFKGRLAVPLTMRFWKGSCHMDLDMCQHKNKLVDAYIGSLYIWSGQVFLTEVWFKACLTGGSIDNEVLEKGSCHTDICQDKNKLIWCAICIQCIAMVL